jgi:hypothetical protein
MWYEFQAKCPQYPVFNLKTPDYSENNLMSPDKKVFAFSDGQRFIGKVVDTRFVNGAYFWKVEDTEGNDATISSKQFHKITSHKNFSKRFIQFKIDKHIID